MRKRDPQVSKQKRLSQRVKRRYSEKQTPVEPATVRMLLKQLVVTKNMTDSDRQIERLLLNKTLVVDSCVSILRAYHAVTQSSGWFQEAKLCENNNNDSGGCLEPGYNAETFDKTRDVF